MDLFRDFVKRGLKDAGGVGIGDHDPGNTGAVFGELAIEVFVEHAAFTVSLEVNNLTKFTGKTRHGGGGEVGPVCGMRNKDDIPFLAPVAMVGLEQFDADEFALGPGQGLGRDAGESGNFFKPFLNFVQEIQ